MAENISKVPPKGKIKFNLSLSDEQKFFIDLAATHSAFAARSETIDQQHDRKIDYVNQRVDNILDYIVDNPSAASEMIEENSNENLQD